MNLQDIVHRVTHWGAPRVIPVRVELRAGATPDDFTGTVAFDKANFDCEISVTPPAGARSTLTARDVVMHVRDKDRGEVALDEATLPIFRELVGNLAAATWCTYSSGARFTPAAEIGTVMGLPSEALANPGVEMSSSGRRLAPKFGRQAISSEVLLGPALQRFLDKHRHRS